MEIRSIDSFIGYYENLRERTSRLIREVPRDHLEWSYKEEKFTIGDVIRHIAAIERFMFAENILGRPSRYNGCSRALADGYDAVLAFFNRMHDETIAMLKGLSVDDLQEKCVTPSGVPITKWKWLRAMAEHEVHHRGELYIYLNLVGVKTPPMFGLTSEEVQARSVKD